jgi:predicted Zn-ribbon and HTH transcriptional regulator
MNITTTGEEMSNTREKEKKNETKVLSAFCKDCGKNDCITEIRNEVLGCTRCKAENIGFRLVKLK